MSVRTRTYVMVGADVGSRIRDRYRDWDAMFEDLKPLMACGEQKAEQLAIVEDGYGNRYTRVGLLLCDPLRDDEPGSLDVETDPDQIAQWITRARIEVRARLHLDIEPKLLVFTECS